MKSKKIGKALLSATLVTALVGGVVATPVTASAVSKPAKVKISSVKSSSVGKLTVKWKKAKRAKKYQVRIGTNKACTKNKKTATLSSKKRTKTFSSLKQGKKYYVKVRAYTTYKKKGKKKTYKKYGSWSKVKSVTVKKASTSTKKPTTSPSKPTKPTNPSNPSNPTNPGSGNNPGSGGSTEEYPWFDTLTADDMKSSLDFWGIYDKVKNNINFMSESECLENGGHFDVPIKVEGNPSKTHIVKCNGAYVAASYNGAPLVSPNYDVIIDQSSLRIKYKDVNANIKGLFSDMARSRGLTFNSSYAVVADTDNYTTLYQCTVCGHRHEEKYDFLNSCNHLWKNVMSNKAESLGYKSYCRSCGIYK